MVSDAIPPNVEAILRQVPGWTATGDVHVEPLAGLTNKNYAVTVDGERFVVRVSRANAAALGIDRELEVDALTVASRAGIAPELVHAILPQGHLVTRYIAGHHWTLDEWRQRENLRRLVDTVKRLHALPPVKVAFSPFRRVRTSIKRAQELKSPFPNDFDRFVKAMETIEQDQRHDTEPWLRFCHNDLFCVNVIDSDAADVGGRVRFLDWEFAGMGDLYFDLATIAYAFDSVKTLSRELQEYVLTRYFDEVSNKHWRRFNGMLLMLMFFSAMWGLVQFGMLQEGQIEPVEDFDYLEYAEVTFEVMREFLSVYSIVS